MNTAMEDFLHRASTPITCRFNNDLEDVASACSAVDVGVSRINRHTIDEAFVLGKGTVKDCQLALLDVQSPQLDCIIVHCHEASIHGVEELYVLTLLLQLCAGWSISF